MGGAIYASGTGSPTQFIDCDFIRNHTYGEGGAIEFSGDYGIEVIGCKFIQNDCNYGGGAIAFYGSIGTSLRFCLFADNYTMYRCRNRYWL